jgi:hypothetical protein
MLEELGLILLRDDGREDDCGGSAEKVIDAPLPTTPPDVPAEEDLTWGKRGICDKGVLGACAICATPLGVRSILSKVVGLVLAAMLLKVFGLDKYDDAESEGEGEGGLLGGKGLTEASSSASRLLVGDHVDSLASDDRGVDRSPSSESTE